MRKPVMTVPELTMPGAALGSLRRSLAELVGEDAAAAALRSAGYAAGDAFFSLLSTHSPGGGETPATELAEPVFWRRLADLFAERGWGSLSHAAVHPGVGALEATDWAEADPANDVARPSCVFTTGLLANLLGRAADAEVAVMEVECRSRGDLACRFLFGGEAALRQLHETMVAGASIEYALEQLV